MKIVNSIPLITGRDVPSDSSSIVICSINLLAAFPCTSSENSEFSFFKKNDFTCGESRHSLHRKAIRRFKLMHDSCSVALSFLK